MPEVKAPSQWRAMVRRWLKFNAVSAAGVAVQAGALTMLASVIGLHYLAATALAVEAAVLHNFVWHWKWTWADRCGVAGAGVLKMLLRFHLTTGVFSIGGNLVCMRLLVGTAGLEPVPANLLTIAVCSLLNYFLSDRLVFIAAHAAQRKRETRTVLC